MSDTTPAPAAETPAQNQMEVDNTTPAQAPPAAATPTPAAATGEATPTPAPVQAQAEAASPAPGTSLGGLPQSSLPAPTTTATPQAKPEDKKKDVRKNLPIREYLDSTVVPVLLAAMSQLTRERPDADEVEWLANWMLKNNPNKKKDQSS